MKTNDSKKTTAPSIRNQEGSTAILVAVLLPVLIGFMALAFDMGYMFLYKNHMQVAADSAALVAAGSRQKNQDINTAQAWALTATQANGYTHGIDGTVITVNIPPGGSASYAADTHFVRVTVAQPVSVFFAGIFGINRLSVSATAVSGPAPSSMPCLLTLASSMPSAVSMMGNGTLIANNCGMYVNSNSGTALTVTGTVTVKANPIKVVGGSSVDKNSNVSPITNGATAIADPFASLAMPAFTSCTYTNFKKAGNGPLTLNPGTYCGGISITGTHSVTFNSGMYVLYGGGMTLASNISPITGSNLTFYNSGNGTSYPYGNISFSGGGVSALSAPTTGTYAGMLVMQNPNNTLDATVNGNAESTLAGNFYFPKNNVNLGGTSSTIIPIGTVVAMSVKVSGGSLFNMINTYGSYSTSYSHAGLYQ